MNRCATLAATLACLLLIAGCGESSSGAGPAETAEWLIADEPAGALTVARAKSDASEGDTITVRGRVGGRVDPISRESPLFTIVDLEIPHCGEIKGDACPTPWDYCCEPGETMKKHSATVLIVGDDNHPITGDPASAGLKPLDEVVVVGVVGARPSGDVLLIRARAVHRVGG